jgi:hypothetical protein
MSSSFLEDEMVVALDTENTLGKSEWFTAGHIDQFEIDHVDDDAADPSAQPGHQVHAAAGSGSGLTAPAVHAASTFGE